MSKVKARTQPPSLFGRGDDGPAETRREAAERIAAHSQRMRDAVLALIQARGDEGATDEEIKESLHLKPDTSRARRCELRDAGLVGDSGRRRPTRSGRLAVVWIAAACAPPAARAPGRAATRSRPGLGLGPIDGKPGGVCYWCGGGKWWRSTGGRIICRSCHPPLSEAVVDKRIEAGE